MPQKNRESYMGCCEIKTLATPIFWDWQASELNALLSLDARKIGDIIVNRLDSGGCDVTDAYISLFDDNKIRFIMRCAEKKTVTLSQVARLAGVSKNCVFKAEKGRYGYSQLLSRLVDLSDDNDAKNVITLRGRDYLECFAEHKKNWFRSGAKQPQNIIETIDFDRSELISIVDCINKNDIIHYCDLSDLVMSQHSELFNAIIIHSEWLQAYLKSRERKLQDSC